MKRTRILILFLLLVIGGVYFRRQIMDVVASRTRQGKVHKSISERLEEYGGSARKRLAPHFEKAQMAYPPARMVLVGIKSDRRLELYATDGRHGFKFIRDWPILAASGELGPKLREGDYQVPEGIYPIELLNPNSNYHLSLRVGYPNQFDRDQAKHDGRGNLGGDIMIHGASVSIGCLAMGDEAAEDLFVVAADTGLPKITVILTPLDFRKGKTPPSEAKLPAWTGELYAQIKTELAQLPVP